MWFTLQICTIVKQFRCESKAVFSGNGYLAVIIPFYDNRIPVMDSLFPLLYNCDYFVVRLLQLPALHSDDPVTSISLVLMQVHAFIRIFQSYFRTHQK